MRRKSVSPRHKHIKRIFALGWTKCNECGDEVCLERMWSYDMSEGHWMTSFRHYVHFCSICAHSKEDVLYSVDVRKILKTPKPPPNVPKPSEPTTTQPPRDE